MRMLVVMITVLTPNKTVDSFFFFFLIDFLFTLTCKTYLGGEMKRLT